MNIEDLLKFFSGFIGITGSIASLIFGFNIAKNSIVTGIIFMVLGVLVSAFCFALLYGFGVMIDKLKEIAKNTKKGVTVQVEYPTEKN